MTKIPGFGDDSDEEGGFILEREPTHYLALDVDSKAIKIFAATLATPGEAILHNGQPPLQVLVKGHYEQLGEEASPEEGDSALYCPHCDKDFKVGCLLHPLLFMSNTPAPAGEEGRAEKTLPAYLRLGNSQIPHAGRGVFTRVPLPMGVAFGPYAGILLDDPDSAQKDGYSWTLRRQGVEKHLDASLEAYSNWLRWVNHAVESNLHAFQLKGKIFYRVVRPVGVGEELTVDYGEKYGEALVQDAEERRRNRPRRRPIPFPI